MYAQLSLTDLFFFLNPVSDFLFSFPKKIEMGCIISSHKTQLTLENQDI